jgi:uncharacterized damage-inducible protein DinB
MTLAKHYIEDVVYTLQKQKALTDNALKQVADENYFLKPGDHSNSIAVIVKHVAGNLVSRWTDFLGSDGEKPTRDRDQEFVIAPTDTRKNLNDAWEAGWAALLGSLAALKEDDLLKKVLIRGEEHTVTQAIDRTVAHTANHVGQIVYLARLLTRDGWQWLTVPPGKSKEFKGKYLK